MTPPGSTGQRVFVPELLRIQLRPVLLWEVESSERHKNQVLRQASV